MESLRKQESELFTLLDRVATDQHTQLLSSLLNQLKPYSKGKPHLLLMPNALERVRTHSEASVDLEMRGKTPEPIDFGGYTLVVPLSSKDPFGTLYLTRPFSNKLKLTAFTKQPLIFPFALWLTLNPNHPGITPEGFNPIGAFNVHRGPAPTLPINVMKPNDLITATVLLRESLETRSINHRDIATLEQMIPYPIEREVGKRFFPPLQVVRSGMDDILRPESYLLRLPIVPLIVTHADGPRQTLIQLETVPAWPSNWHPETGFTNESQRFVTIGEGTNYDLFTLLTLMRDLAEATTATEDIYWPIG
ncbi:MAG: hypothetical protein ACFFD8_03085 [Candidatus Thorarchaeota archaeon]